MNSDWSVRLILSSDLSGVSGLSDEHPPLQPRRYHQPLPGTLPLLHRGAPQHYPHHCGSSQALTCPLCENDR